MANPNIVNVSTINGNTGVLNVTTSATAIVTNSSGSNKVYKLNSLYVSNNDASTGYKLTADLYRSATAYPFAVSVTIPTNSTLDVISKPLYLLEGDTIRLTADTNSKLVAVCSWEEIS
jgi:hypothetical protein